MYSFRRGRINISASFSQSVKDLIIEHGYDENFGARPLARAIQNHILDLLAMEIIEGKISSGDAIEIDAYKNEIVIKKK